MLHPIANYEASFWTVDGDPKHLVSRKDPHRFDQVIVCSDAGRRTHGNLARELTMAILVGWLGTLYCTSGRNLSNSVAELEASRRGSSAVIVITCPHAIDAPVSRKASRSVCRNRTNLGLGFSARKRPLRTILSKYRRVHCKYEQACCIVRSGAGKPFGSADGGERESAAY
jgi:hypothetical protein